MARDTSYDHKAPQSNRFGVIPDLGEFIESQREVFRGQRLGQFGLAVFVGFVVIGLIAPLIAPYRGDEVVRNEAGEPVRWAAPSMDHLLGTTQYGHDVASQLILGTRMSLLIGFVAAAIAVTLGTMVGLISGYYGGVIDNIFMRLTDIAYGIPFLPFLIVLVILLQPSLYTIILGISVLMWRASARVIRSQVLTIKERPYIETAKATGVGDFRLLTRHLLPNVLPLAFLYVAFSVNIAILAEASLAFLGFGDPNSISWGTMLFNAYNASAHQQGWWWIVAPGVALSLIVISVFAIARAYEVVTNPELEAQD